MITDTRKKEILVVDDEEDILKALDVRLSAAGYLVTKARSGEEAFSLIRKSQPDLILLDIILPNQNGFEVKKKLNETPSTALIPVIFLTALGQMRDKIKGLESGFDDYITKPYEPQELIIRIEAALARRRIYEEITMIDGITGLYNVYFFKKEFKRFFAIARRYKRPFSLVLIDFDDFKSINDTYGHLAGDSVLRDFAEITQKELRSTDIITRYGGDEFAIIMPEVDSAQAKVAIERLKNKVAKHPFAEKAAKIKLSCSISTGIVEYRDGFNSEEEMFGLADRIMYEDKRGKSVKNTDD